MLHRSFKPAKCKTSLRLAMARIKLLKNKEAAHLKQLKREVAQLLESGQDQTARIRVEHVTREEKTMAAYDLLEIYCELIVARLPIIESQKNCPIDLKEAIASVVFASQRCADVTELADVRKHFTAKYGKEFISSALELLPDSGVNRTMVEKLSARAPDGETKIKILTTIAQEHNINWDPNSFGGNDPKIREDFMNQPSTLENVTKMHVQAPYEQTPINRGQKHEASVRPSESNAGSSPYSQTRTPDHSSHNITMSAMYHPEMRPSAFGTEEREFGNTFSENKNDFHLNRRNWSMEFKDATSAAQAAAESAERASMAARAAAELSSRGKIASQYSTESRASSIYGVKYEGAGKSFSPVFDGEGEPVTRDSASKVHNSLNTSYDMNPRMQNQQKGRNDQENVPGVSGGKYNDRDSSKRSGVPASSEPSVTSIDNDISRSNLQMADGYSQKSSSVERTNFDWQAKKPERVDFLGNLNVNKQFPESEAQFANHQHQMKKTENGDGSGEESIRKQSFRSASSHSHASHDDEDNAIANFNVRSRDDNVELSSNIFQGNRQEDTRQQLSHDYSPVFFDESGSDDDKNFDTPSRESSHFSEKVSTWSPGNNRSGFFEKSTAQPHFSTELHFPSEFAERPTISSSGDLLAATFDDSDGVSSESEEEMNKLKLNERKESSGPSYEQSVYSRNSAFTDSGIHELRGSTFVKRGSTGANRPQLHSFDDSVSEETLHDKRQEIDMDVRGESLKAYDLGELPTEQKYPRQTRSQGNSDQDNSRFSRLSMGHKVDTKEDVGTLRQSYGTEDNSESQNLSSSESGHELNFGKLRGGLRNRGYRHPPYTKDLSSDASRVSAQQSQAIPDIMSEPTNLLGVESSVTNQARNQESLNPKVHKKVHKESKTSAPKTFFDSDDDGPEDIHQRQPVVTKREVGGTISRRTQGSSAKSEAATRSRPTVQSEEPASSYFGMGEKVSSKGSSATEPLPKLRAQVVRSETRDRSESQGTGSFAEQPSSKPMPESNTSAHRGTSKLPTADKPSVPPSKVTSSGRTESPRKPILSGDSTSRENSLKKASHVHPKLPDYDTLASHFESLRSNRR